MSITSGADCAAGPSRLEQRTEHPLAMARPLLVVIALWQFMERGRYPEVVVSCMFQLWRCHRSRTRWPATRTDLSKSDTEAHVPVVPCSRTSTTASFACVEQLGVTPPPSRGWMPPEAVEGKDGDQRGSDGQRSGGSQRAEWQAEWCTNYASSEWIYHTSEDKYFHVPSNSLWERRDMECCDPLASPHTYCRVDAVHLQALSHFARSVDTAVLPLAWKAWVRHARACKRRHFMSCDAVQLGGNSKAAAGRILKSAVILRSLPDVDENPDLVEEEQQTGSADRAAGSKGSKASSPAETAATGKEKPVAVPVAASRDSDVTKVLRKPVSGGARPSEASASRSETSLFLPSSISSIRDNFVGVKPRGRCFCFRLRSKKGRDKYTSTESTQSTDTAMTDGLLGDKSFETGVSSGNSPFVPSRSESGHLSKSRSPRVCARSSSDRHTRRFEHFLAEVKRNPQRLVLHVERRRADKTHLAYVPM
mmetsp:Transcript_41059/g.95117  ORF Transcript_41059/g.95117 Transcript_41059/m.95117 type:complete len:478 (-) Transcript_41059:121-1554(-)|eukprot:CAMPEP_0171100732 /NCGR_PEP_ID=MMETSP0766_2-20121228/53127_1 /TAXON_ID=439317 /ORGANISM="Gambierdiscus australes, Strain CAWD 149" /LENGTH=477 /DNA_ID=CAMNT_0011560605 /DNA_START=61 /DNA_END=1494 /DNA_ORIENTATION=+